MKKIVTIALALLLITSLAACKKSDPQTITLNIEDSGVLSEYILEVDGDVVHTIRQTTTMDCTGFVEEQFAIIDEAVAEYKAIYDAIEGVTYEVEVTETAMIEKLTIDATNKDTLKTLSNQGLMPVESGDYISLEKTVKSMEGDGWVVAK